MTTDLANVRVEVAFDANPNTATPAFRDLTSRARLDRGISIGRGRSERFEDIRPGRCTLTLDNDDGALTPGNSGSAYYPNVKPQNRIRVTYRDPSVSGNLLPAEDASFEGGTTGAWGSSYFGAPASVTLANSTTRASHGSRSLRVTFPTAAAGCGTQLTVHGLVIGREYTVQARVYVPTGVPAVQMGNPFSGPSFVNSTITNAWQTLTATWTPTTTPTYIVIRSTAGTTSGQQVWVDSAMIDEGDTAAAFTTTPAPIVHRYDGYVTEWPTEWPTGGESHSTSTITAYDLLSRLARSRTLNSVIAETVRTLTPLWYFPLNEADGATSVGDIAGKAATLDVLERGSDGVIEFAAATGPPTDGGSSPKFTPAGPGDGFYLSGEVPPWTDIALSSTLVAQFLSPEPGAAAQTIARWSDAYGLHIELGLDSDGKAYAAFVNPWNTDDNETVTSSPIFADNRTHTGAVTLALSGGTYTMTLTVDGTVRGSTSWSTTASLIYKFDHLDIGGTQFGTMFTGSISHVLGTRIGLTLAQLQAIHESATTGFAGERSDERIARVLGWVGIPTALQSLDVGLSTMGHIDPAGKSVATYLSEVAFTEGGAVFACVNGCLKFYSRDRVYDTTATVVASATADDIDPSTELATTLDRLVNIVRASRPGGATVRIEDATSAAAYGTAEESIDIAAATDEEVLDRANWFLNDRATPRTILPQLALDALTVTTGARELEIGDRVQVTGMPSQAPSSTFDLVSEGYDEQIGRGGWSVVVNASPFLALAPLILDDDPRGELDSGNVLVY